LAKTTLVDLSRIGPVNTKTTAVKQDKLRQDGTVSLELKSLSGKNKMKEYTDETDIC